MDKKDKIATLIGFAVKSGGIVRGSDAVARSKKILVLLLSRDAGPNTAKEITAKASRENIPLLVPKNTNLEDLVHKENCKTAGITHKELAKGILENINNEDYFITGGSN